MAKSWWERNRAMALPRFETVTFVLLTIVCSIGFGGPPAHENTPAQPLSSEVAAAWKNAGAVVGWIRPDAFGCPTFASEKAGVPGELPAFRFTNLKIGKLAKLPIPAVAFGLSLEGDAILDDGPKRLPKLQSLHTLIIEGGVTNAALQRFAGLTNLQVLSLRACPVSDSGLTHLKSLERLHTLFLDFTKLGGTKITDVGLKDVAGLTDLRTLYLGETQVSDVGMKELIRVKRLHALFLSSTKVTDLGLKEIGKLNGLRWLDLRDNPVTDAGLKELTALKNLDTLLLNSTKTTDEALTQLRKALPGCHISRFPRTDRPLPN